MVKPRPARPTVKCVDTYCELYKNLFPEVRAYECFKYLHVGLISELKRKSLPAIAKIENGIVSVNAYGYCEGMTFPLKFRVFKPLERLKEGEKYQTKPEIGAELVRELSQQGFKIKRVLADSFYGESRSNFLRVLEELGIEYAFFYPQRSWSMATSRPKSESE